jgi:hypothetical protein
MDTAECKWDGCSFQGQDLVDHVTKEHALVGRRECHWNGCTQVESNHYDLLNHLRAHLKYCCFVCYAADCVEAFPDVDQLQVHIKARHEELKDNKLAFFTYLDKLQHSLMTDDSSQRSKKKLTKVTDREFQRITNSRKIDFLKISNITVDDIVSEPSRKKGRTANAEINADLREQYKKDNTLYKDAIMSVAKGVFEKAQIVDPLPSDKEIAELDGHSLQHLHDELERQWLWALEVNNLLENDLERLGEEKEEWNTKKELILDACISLELPDAKDLHTP